MAEQRKQALNNIFVEGYLKENTLTKKITSTGKTAIMGAIIISSGENEDYRIQLYANEKTAMGDLSKNFQQLETLLPENTITIATLLKNNSQTKFIEAKEQASKVWATGFFDIYDKKDAKGIITSYVSLKGMKAGIKNLLTGNPFEPRATFDIGAYVDSIKNEEKEGEETGRVLVGLSIPDYYNEVNIPVECICPNKKTGDQIMHYSIGDSGRFVGSIQNLLVKTKGTGKQTEFMDGTIEEAKTITTFVNERHIEKMTHPFEEGSSDYISVETIKQYKVNRQKKLDEMDIVLDKPKTTTPTQSNSTSNFML